MIGIYKFTNKINGKIYIGQSIDIEHRRKEHLRYKDESYFHRSLMKYGNNNFDFEILEECDIMQLDEKERYWISYYHSNNRDKGYNCTDGGEGGQKKAVQQFDLQNNFIQLSLTPSHSLLISLSGNQLHIIFLGHHTLGLQYSPPTW